VIAVKHCHAPEPPPTGSSWTLLLYPLLGHVTSPMLAAAAMSASSLSVIANALRLRSLDLTTGDGETRPTNPLHPRKSRQGPLLKSADS